MTNFTAEQLLSFGQAVLRAAGASPIEADCVADELVGANRVGHDSHGVMRLVQYVQMMDGGFVRPGSRLEIVNQGPSFAVADGGLNFGQVIMAEVLPLAIIKARQTGTSTIVVRNCNHVGRLGAFTEKLAHEGFVALMAVNSPGPGGVAPFGGIDRKIGTNPLSIAAPAQPSPLVLDMTTSATAEGKLRVAFQKGESVPEGLIIDGHGNPSTNPGDYYSKPFGAILPLGGAMGHKGFGLAVMIDVLCGILSGSGFGRDDLPRGSNGVWLHLIDVGQIAGRDEYDRWIAGYAAHIKSSRRAPGVDEILLPGEIESRRQRTRDAEGIPLPDETLRQLNELGARWGLSLNRP